MNIHARFAALCGSLLTLLVAAAAAQAPGNPLAIRSIAEVESRSRAAGREIIKLIPADRVVPGDRVIYTLEVRNTGATALDAPVVTHPAPHHTHYVPDSPLRPGAQVRYSVQSGRSLDRITHLVA